MLARRLTTILPAMSLPDALDTTRLHRVAGRTGARTILVTTRPCRAPSHHLGRRPERRRPGAEAGEERGGITWRILDEPPPTSANVLADRSRV
jgi:hypothetical protein